MTDLAQVMPTTLPAQANTASSVGIFQFGSFAETMNAAQILSNSSLVPKDYRCFIPTKEYGKFVYDAQGNMKGENNPSATANCLIALNMANRMGYDPLMIMQNLYIIEGRPAWSSQFIIAAINACGKFTPLDFDIENHGMVDVEYTVTQGYGKEKTTETIKTQIENISCVAWTTEKATGKRLESDKIDMVMAVKEGWYQKNGSKWQTMPGQMLRYRAAAFFGRIYAPEILMGIYSADEVRDFVDVTPETPAQASPAVAQTVVAEQIPCYDIKPLLAQIEAITELDEVKPLGLHIKELSENPAINLCGDDLPTLREALTAKRDQIKAQLEQVETTPAEPVTEAPTQADGEPEQSEKSKIVDMLTKAINTVTRANAEETRQALYDSKEIVGETMFNKLEEILDDRLQVMEDEAMQAETT